MNIGKKIKEERIKKNWTQEQLATFLNVSSQAVSRYETTITLPDITILPALANLFNVTVDYLLDVNIIEKEEIINETLNKGKEYFKEGKLDKLIELYRNALVNIPDSYMLMNELADVLVLCARNNNENRNKYLEEAKSYCERIISNEKNQLRYSAITTLSNIYNELNDNKKALEISGMLPTMYCTQEFQSAKVRRGTDKIWQLQTNVLIESEILYKTVMELVSEGKKQLIYDDTEEEFIIQKMISIYEILFDKEDYYLYNCRIGSLYVKLSKISANNNDKESTLNYLKKAKEYMINNDICLSKHIYKSLLLKNHEQDDNVRNTNEHNQCYHLFNYIINNKSYIFLENEKQFNEILNILQEKMH